MWDEIEKLGDLERLNIIIENWNQIFDIINEEVPLSAESKKILDIIKAPKEPDFKENVVLEKGLLVDEAPTFAKILGLELPNADGKPVNEIIREELV